MNEQGPALLEEPGVGQIRHLEPDWVESEWFQVWLELARQPHKNDGVDLNEKDGLHLNLTGAEDCAAAETGAC